MQLLALSTAALVLPARAQPEKPEQIRKKIPSSGIALPVIGMGTWITFNVGQDIRLRQARVEVLREFFAAGGGMIDSSPMYASAEEVVGYGLKNLKYPKSLFSATKVWTSSTEEGVLQIRDSHRLWGLKKFDLIQVHNLDNWENHLKTLFKMKEKGELAHIGVTTSHGRRHSDLEKIMQNHPLDFVQVTYNIRDREVEERILKLAEKRKIAVIANRPFRGGDLIRDLKKKPFPAAAAELGCKNWPDFLLKFVVSHPAITCAIPATSKTQHMRENMQAGVGRLPTHADREKMVKIVRSL